MDVISKIIAAYGIIGIAGIAIAIIFIWLAVHFIAEEGTEVSVLFGLVTYTKRKKSQGFFAMPILEQKNITSSLSKKETYEVVTVNSTDRVYINKSLEEIFKTTMHMTGLQRNKFYQENYNGKWMRIKGRIEEIVQSGEDAMVFLSLHPTVTFNFFAEQADKVSHLEKGDEVTIDGQISQISSSNINFKSSQIIAKVA